MLTSKKQQRASEAAAAIKESLAWAMGEDLGAGASLPRERVSELVAISRGERHWSYDHYDELALAIQALRSMAGAPRHPSRGDSLNALDHWVYRDGLHGTGAEAWAYEPAIDEKCVREMGYAEASLGIESQQRKNREGWWTHAQRNRAFILRAADRVERPRVVVLLGAGQTHDLPLNELVRRFDRVVLVDIDAAAMGRTVSRRLKSPAERERVALRTADVTGVAGQLVQRARALIAEEAHPVEAERRLAALYRSYYLAEDPPLVAIDEDVDLVVSSLLLSQLTDGPLATIRRIFRERYGRDVSTGRSAVAHLAAVELAHRIQQDHINALTRSTKLAVLTSDVGETLTVLGSDRREHPAGPERPLLAVPHLRDRATSCTEVLEEDVWPWHRVVPRRRGERGSYVRIESLLLRGESAV